MLKTLYSFDGTEKSLSQIERPDRYTYLFELLNLNKTFIARGAGLSYCGSSFGSNVLSIDTRLFNRILEFDQQKGTITVETGIQLGNFLSFIEEKGWSFHVIPGYPRITIGGCVAFNVHGKSQTNSGIFGDHVIELSLFHPLHGELICSRDFNKDLFDITIGGFGLTGFITKVKLQLKKISGNALSCSKKKTKNLMDAVEIMKRYSDEYDYIYSWNNLNKRGDSFGKGVVYLEKILNAKINSSSIKYGNLSSENRKAFKIRLLNPLMTKVMCEVFYIKEILNTKDKVVNIKRGSFPINGKEIYFKLFGKKGLREYQLIIPYKHWQNFTENLQKLIEEVKIPIALGSLKLFDGKLENLSFSQTGVCLAIDVPATNKSKYFFSQLDDLVIRYSGIANPSKDSRINSDTIAKMYPDYVEFKNKLYEFDPQKRFSSNLRERLKL